MTPFLHRALAPTAIFLATAALAQAHPGHDGHDFTWDFGHLSAYPGATVLCLGVLGVMAWGVWQVVRGPAEAPKGAVVRSDDPRRER